MATSSTLALIVLVIFLPPLLGLSVYILIRGFHEDILFCMEKNEIKGLNDYLGLTLGYCLTTLILLLAIYSIFRFNIGVYNPMTQYEAAIGTIFVLALTFLVRIYFVIKNAKYFDVLSLFVGASFLIVFMDVLLHLDYYLSGLNNLSDAWLLALAAIENFLAFINVAIIYAFFGSLSLSLLGEQLLRYFKITK